MTSADQLDTLLRDAAKTGKVPAARHAISKGADVNAVDAHGWTPLHYAARYNAPIKFVDLLVAVGAHVSARDRHNCTPLHLATAYGASLDLIKLLVASGADPLAQSSAGWTCHEMAQRHNHIAAAEYLTTTLSNSSFRSRVVETNHRDRDKGIVER